MTVLGKRARISILVFCGLVAALFLYGPASGTSAKKPSGDTLVTSSLADAGDITSGTNNRIQSDGQGSYFHGVSSVISQIQGIGDWELDIRSSSTRTILLDFRDPVAGSSTGNAPFDWQLVRPRFISKCSQTQSGGYLSLSLNATLNCPLHATFSHGGVTYRLTMNPVNDAATTFAQVTCTGANAGGQCIRWVIAPVNLADGSTRSIAVLLQESTVRGKTTLTNLGYFYMTFAVGLTNP